MTAPGSADNQPSGPDSKGPAPGVTVVRHREFGAKRRGPGETSRGHPRTSILSEAGGGNSPQRNRVSQ